MRKEAIKPKDIEKVIPISQKVDVFIRDGNFKGVYSSYIYDLDDNYIYLLQPTNKNGLNAVIRHDEEFDVSFINKDGKRMGFSSKLKEIIKEDDKTILKISKPKEVFYRIELRENFRVDILAEAEVIYLKNSSPKRSKSTIIDISASGAKISANIELSAELNVGEVVYLTFELEDGMKVENLEARIVRKAIATESGVHHYGLQFVNLDRKLHEKMVKFCLNKQLEFVRKMRGM
jgi:c-di-GMP-binding flagellar brake protein YcgR